MPLHSLPTPESSTLPNALTHRSKPSTTCFPGADTNPQLALESLKTFLYQVRMQEAPCPLRALVFPWVLGMCETRVPEQEGPAQTYLWHWLGPFMGFVTILPVTWWHMHFKSIITSCKVPIRWLKMQRQSVYQTRLRGECHFSRLDPLTQSVVCGQCLDF